MKTPTGAPNVMPKSIFVQNGFQTIVQRFQSGVQKHPEQLALVAKGKSLSYQELDERSDALAAALLTQGVEMETMIPLFCTRSAESIIGMLGVLKAGCAYVPVIPDYPKDRIQFILDEIKAPILICEDETASRASELELPSLNISSLKSPVETIEFPEVAPPNLAYVLYTSGSTGRPKGVMIDHQCVDNQICGFQEYAPIAEGFNGLCLSPFVFDASVWEIYIPLFFGGTLYLIDTHFVVELDAFIDFLDTKQIHSCYLPASLLPPLTQKLGNRKPLPMKRVLTGAEPIKQRVWDAFEQSIPGLELVNIYGPTETTVGVTYYKTGASTPPDGRVPIGKPVAGYTVYLVDENGQFCKPGKPGEIWVAGPGVGRGYVNPTPENKGRYTTDPFDPEGGRLYKTGDLAHYLPDGNLEFNRRKDLQVKVRGHRIELGEVESVMEQIPNLLEAVAITRADASGNNLLVGYFRKAKNAGIQIKDIREAMAKKVPHYMVPTQIIELEDFPRTPNGKIDRRNLPLAPLTAEKSIEPPKTPMEAHLLNIWTEVLPIGNISTTDSFFELGGHSLLALQLISRIADELDHTLKLKALYQSPTIKSLASYLDQKERQEAWPKILPNKTDASKGYLSSAQKRLWFIEQANQDSNAYNIPFEFILKGPLDVRLLEEAFNVVVSRHDALRSAFKSTDGIPEVHISSAITITLHEQDLRHEKDAKLIAGQWSKDFACYTFDLTQAPLIKLGLLRLADDQWHLLFCIHHIISDASSVDLLMKEWSRVYDGLLQGTLPESDEPQFQYTDYTRWQEAIISEGYLKPQLAYWQNQLEGAPSFLPLPTDFKRPEHTTFDGGSIVRYLPASFRSELEQSALREGVSLSTLTFTAFSALLQIYSNEEDIVVGMPVANRTQKAMEEMQGFFINMLPIRIQGNGATSLKELTAVVHESVVEALSNQDTPFDLILQQTKVKRTPGINPLFQVMFNFQNAYDGSFELSQMEVEPLGYHNEVAQFDLTLFITEELGQMKCTFEYNAQLFFPERIERMADQFIKLLHQILNNPSVSIAQSNYLDEQERQALINNSSPLPDHLSPLIYQFESAAAKYADRTALVFRERALSYAQVNARANQLAHFLASAQPKAQQKRAAILLPRSADMLITLLAVQKAGFSYIPLDPTHPAKRLQLILEDARPELVISLDYLKGQLTGFDGQIIALDQHQQEIEAQSTANPTANPLKPEDELYLIYTSGSTGKPKGVCLGNRSVANYLESINDRPGITPQDRFYAITTISFDIAVMELYWPLLNGAQVVIADKEAVLDPRIMAKELEAHDITLMQGTPATWKMLIQDGWGGKSGLKALSGGEALDKKLAEGLFRRCAEVWNFYGPTETTVYSAIHQIREQDFATGPTSLVPVGTPVRHNWLYVLNEELQPVPKGVAGEVYIGGASLAKGYLNLPGLTGERFIPNPFAPGTKMYRTGDRGFFHFSGELEFIERIDNQVKIRGFRIELAEIEQALLEHPSVAACAARAWENNAGIPALYIYAVAEQGDLPNWPELKAFLAERLPAYMVPASLSWLDELPHTPNGKVDRKSLPKPEQQQQKSTELPVNDTEATVLELFKQALELGSISVTDDFFDLGGHSLLAVALMAKIEASFEQRLPLASLFQHGSPRGIAQLLSNEAQIASGWKSLVPIKASGSRPPLYIVHGAGLNVLLFNTLSKHMHPDQPVYGLQAKGMNGIDEPLYSINEIADYYLEQVLEHQPKGPYAIAGFSFGGFVAFEMGRKLLDKGEEIAFIGLLDAVALPVQDIAPIKRVALQLGFNLKYAFSSSPSQTLALWKKKVKTLRYEIKYRFLQKQNYAGIFEGLEDDVPDYQKVVQHAKYTALNNYDQRPYPVKVHLFKAQKQTFFVNDPKQYDWQHYALNGVEVIDVPGEHSQIFAPPNEQIFAKRLQKALDESFAKDI